MKNQAIHINGLENHLLCLMQFHLNGLHISEVSKFSTESPSVTTHALELTDLFNAVHPLIIPLQLSQAISYFDVYSISIAEYENEDILKIHLIDKEPPWDPSTKEYSEREICTLDHQGQVSIPATAAREPVYVSIVISYSLANDASDEMMQDKFYQKLKDATCHLKKWICLLPGQMLQKEK